MTFRDTHHEVPFERDFRTSEYTFFLLRILQFFSPLKDCAQTIHLYRKHHNSLETLWSMFLVPRMQLFVHSLTLNLRGLC